MSPINKYFLVVYLLSYLLLLANGGTIVNKLGRDPDVTKSLCDNLDDPRHGLFTPFSCIKNESHVTNGVIGAYFKQRYFLTETDLDPVVLIPGLGGSGLEAMIDKKTHPAWYCYRKTKDWFRIWVSLGEFVAKSCWLDNMQVYYNATTDDYHNAEGVQIRARDFGGLDGITYMDYEFGYPIAATSMFATIINSFVKAGYVAGKNLRGAPYDWRMPASSESKMGWANDLRNLIEETYSTNGNRSVHVISHSLGGPTSLFFFNTMTQEWKNKYIKTYVPIAGPWAGASSALRAVISGDNFGIAVHGHNLVSNLACRALARQAGGVIELVPNRYMWDSDQVFVTTNKRNYTVAQFDELFADMNAPVTAAIYQSVGSIVSKLQPPGVPTHCLHGVGVPTEFGYTYPDGDFDKDPIVNQADLGDGTVPIASLRQCIKWADQQSSPVVHKEFPSDDHLSILKDEALVNYLLSVVTSKI